MPPSDDVANLVRNATRNIRGSAAPRVLLARLQSCLNMLQSPESNDTFTLAQAAAICQALAEVAAMNGDDLNRAL